MRLFYHDDSKQKSYEQVVEACQKGYGIKHPERISGFDAFFYRLDDIYLYGKLETWVENNPELENELNVFIKRFLQEDYGFVTGDEQDNNIENKWLCGSCRWTIGRYYFEKKELRHFGGIVLEFLRNRGFLYSIEEDMSEIYKEYAGTDYRSDLIYKALVQVNEK